MSDSMVTVDRGNKFSLRYRIRHFSPCHTRSFTSKINALINAIETSIDVTVLNVMSRVHAGARDVNHGKKEIHNNFPGL